MLFSRNIFIAKLSVKFMVNYLDLIIIRESARIILFYFFKAFEWVYHVGLFSHIPWLFDVDVVCYYWFLSRTSNMRISDKPVFLVDKPAIFKGTLSFSSKID